MRGKLFADYVCRMRLCRSSQEANQVYQKSVELARSQQGEGGLLVDMAAYRTTRLFKIKENFTSKSPESIDGTMRLMVGSLGDTVELLGSRGGQGAEGDTLARVQEAYRSTARQAARIDYRAGWFVLNRMVSDKVRGRAGAPIMTPGRSP